MIYIQKWVIFYGYARTRGYLYLNVGLEVNNLSGDQNDRGFWVHTGSILHQLPPDID